MGRNEKKPTPARTIEGRTNQLVSEAVDLAEKKLLNGTASSQIICLLLNLATTKAQLELEQMRNNIELSKAKVRHIDSQDELQDTYNQAIEAMKMYRGSNYEEEDYEGYYER